MSALARFFLAVYSLLLIAACAGLIALSFNDDEMLDLSIGDYNIQALVESSDGARWAVTVILGAIALIGAITLLIAFFPWRPRHRTGQVRIQRAGGGTVEITTAALEHLLHEEIRTLHGVRQVSPVIRARGDTIESEITLSIDPGANIADVTSTVSEATGAVLREQVGATQVRRPTIRITYDELAIRHPAPRPLAPPEGPLPPPPGIVTRRPTEEPAERISWQPPADPRPDSTQESLEPVIATEPPPEDSTQPEETHAGGQDDDQKQNA